MKEDRKHPRIDCEEYCMLNMSGWYYPATVKNVSLEGALVTSSKLLTSLNAGDTCTILVGEGSYSYCECSCKVVRVEGHDVALKIFHGSSENPFTDILAKFSNTSKKKRRLDNVGKEIDIQSEGTLSSSSLRLRM
ncbi:PilZ domain-containing protein [Geobacter pelophilus]|uniref:PilZ domain-containing protein n=1 Tax=Geoanaerobacter pelophilus TaxID=60036 RepID=A0AAW4L1W3_9BACT|nr:PilZ domain-containing protein [Geoanaerobacter pelophilus]MBT0664966.1 PilZ domain-containing protein [Geoanaerobacter pelophilus]